MSTAGRRAGALLLLLTLAACGQPPPPAAKAPATASTPAAGANATKPAVRFHDAEADGALRQRRGAFQQAVTALLKQPDAGSLKAGQDSWSALYKAFNEHYLRLAVRACALDREALMGRLDSWPFYPAYVDALPAWPDSGIVNDPTLHLSATELLKQQGATDDGEIALGFQPLWLLIAGVRDAPRRPKALLAAVNENVERRRTYLKLAAEQLERDLSVLGTETDQNVDDLRCALSLLDDRLQRLADNRDTTDPAGGLYVPAHSVAIIDAAQPASALAQLASPANADLRAALEQSHPGFQDALDRARQDKDWTPLRAWLNPSDDQGDEETEDGD